MSCCAPCEPTQNAIRRVLVTGARGWMDQEAVFGALDSELGNGDFVLVHGDCPTGADLIASVWAKAANVRQERYPAEWHRYGRAAGMRRNQVMVDLGADVCHAFLVPDSRGTADCVRRARRAGIPVCEHWSSLAQ